MQTEMTKTSTNASATTKPEIAVENSPGRACAQCKKAMAEQTGFYGFADATSLANRFVINNLYGLYYWNHGPQHSRRKSAARFDLCGACVLPFIAAYMQPIGTGKHKSISNKDVQAAALQLPDSLSLSRAEKASAVRLVRLTRSDSWLGYFIEWLLQKDAESSTELSIKEFENILKQMSSLNDFIEFSETLKKEAPSLARHPGIAWIPQATQDDEVVIPEEEDQFRQLDQQWRLQHPEPEKRPCYPTGHLGREDSED